MTDGPFRPANTFVKVVELGSFARAAERLGLSTSAVSRQVAELEKHLDVRLLNRTTRRLSLTEAGQAFYERCVQLLADLDEAEASVRSATRRAEGHAAPDLWRDVWRALPRAGDRRVRDAPPAAAVRPGSLRSHGRPRRRGVRSRDPHRTRRANRAGGATHRLDTTRLLRGAGVPAATRRFRRRRTICCSMSVSRTRMSRRRTPGPSRTRGATPHRARARASPRQQRSHAGRAGSRRSRHHDGARLHRGARDPRRARWAACCRSSRRHARRSRPSIRAGGTCPRRFGRSSISSRTDFPQGLPGRSERHAWRGADARSTRQSHCKAALAGVYCGPVRLTDRVQSGAGEK